MFDIIRRIFGASRSRLNAATTASPQVPSRWWKKYPKQVPYAVLVEATPADRPDERFIVGAAVRLQGKPQQVRKVIAVEWHRIRREYVYCVETSAENKFRPYWFGTQLTPP